jgi:nitrate reductase beta subunit
MKIRAQIGMVLNLDKCIGCHTCSVTCKNVWTSRPGMEYAWFNNVETKPGIGYPKEWENQDKWNGGWVRKSNGKIEPRQGGKWKLLMKIFANPNLPQIDDYYEPFTFDYDHLQSAPEMKASPHGAPAQPDHRQAHGQDRMGPELGRNPGRRVQPSAARTRTSTTSRRTSTASSKTPS